MWFDVSFGKLKTGLATVGYRQYDDTGGDAVARTTTGVVEIGNGGYGVDFVPDIDMQGIEWDTGEVAGKIVFAHEALNHVEEFPRGVAIPNFPVTMLNDVDHITPQAGLTVSGFVKIDGGNYVALTNGVTEASLGTYQVDLEDAEMDGAIITLRFTAAADADPTTITIFTNRN